MGELTRNRAIPIDCAHGDRVSTYCQFRDALGNRVITAVHTPVAYVCPSARDQSEPGGTYALYSAPVLPMDRAAAIVCRAD